MTEQNESHRTVEYKFLRQSPTEHVPKKRFLLIVLLAIFQVVFFILFGTFVRHQSAQEHNDSQVPGLYAMFMDVHSMMFVGFGFLMTFLKRYGYSSVGYNFLIAAFVLEWALLVRGFIGMYEHGFKEAFFVLDVNSLIVADFCSAAILISFGAVLGKTSLSQLIVMAFVEVILQSINEHIGLHVLQAYDIGESMYVHVFGAYFGMAVAKVLHHKEVESSKESSHYHSDIFAMIGTIFLWLYWPSFNSGAAVGEGQTRAIVNTFLSIVCSCVVTFMVSTIVHKGKLDMVHVQNATLAGGVAIGTVADMAMPPYGAMLIGSAAGALSVLGYEYLSPLLKKVYLHDTCGVNNLHGMPGLLSGLIGGLVALLATTEAYGTKTIDGAPLERLYTFYPSRTPCEADQTAGCGRDGSQQALFQLAALGVTLLISIGGGVLTGLLMKIPILEQVSDEEEMFDDEPGWVTPADYSLKLTEVRAENVEMQALNA